MRPNPADHHCNSRTAKGQPCKARPVDGSAFCAFHDPARAEAVAAGRRAGGCTRSQPRRTVGEQSPDCPLGSVRDVCDLLSTTINDVRKGRLDPKIANTVGYLASVLVKAMETGDLEERLAMLETAVKGYKPTIPAFEHEFPAVPVGSER